MKKYFIRVKQILYAWFERITSRQLIKSIDQRVDSLCNSLENRDGELQREPEDPSLRKNVDQLLTKVDELCLTLHSLQESPRFEENNKELSRIHASLEEVRTLLDNNNQKIDPLDSKSEYISQLQQQVVSLQQSTCLKLMRKYVLDTQIRLYNLIANRIQDLGHEDELEKILEIMKDNLSEIGVSFMHSLVGSSFNPQVMRPSLKEQYTLNKELDKTVAVSLTPSFIWNLPEDGMNNASITLQKEEVILWKFTEDITLCSESLETDDNQTLEKSSSKNSTNTQLSNVLWGNFVLQQEEEIIGIYPILIGHNIFGNSPTDSGDKFLHPINILEEKLMPTHFEVIVDTVKESTSARVLNGEWYVNYPEKKPKSFELESGDFIVIGSLKFTYIEGTNE